MVVVDDAVDPDSLPVHMQMSEYILPVRSFDFPGVADVDNPTQFRATTSNDGLQQRREIPTQRFLIFFGSTGQITRYRSSSELWNPVEVRIAGQIFLGCAVVTATPGFVVEPVPG